MTASLGTRLGTSLCALTLALAGLGAPPLRAQTGDCFDPSEPTPERFGPTNISAVTGNRGLTVALDPDATVTVFKWPSPSYYDQIKYRTTDRSLPRMGALPNEGAFTGIAYKRPGRKRWRMQWLREWPSTQRFHDDDDDAVVTTFTNSSLGLRVVQTDVVDAHRSVLARDLKVTRDPDSTVQRVRVIAFANFNPVVSKIRQAPVADWCTEERNDDGATFLGKEGVIVHERTGIDESTGETRSVATVLALGEEPDGHQVGMDSFESGTGTSAYEDASDGRLSGDGQASGQADAALMAERDLRDGPAKVRVLMAAAATRDDALTDIAGLRSRTTTQVVRAKHRWWTNWLAPARLPAGAPSSVVRLAKRALISIRQATDPTTDLIVTSIATQSPLGLDWIRHGAYINRALYEAGHPEMVGAHNRTYADLQAGVTKPPGGETTPSGNWSQNFYGDGVVGGAIPYEIDATGLGLWTLWDHQDLSPGDSYFDAVYDEIQRSAHYLTDDPPLGCRDPSGLQCPAHEEDGTSPSQTLVGAQAVWLGLGAAVDAATERGTEEALINAERWAARRDELAAAIDANFFDEGCGCYTNDAATGGTLLWPVGFLNDRPDRALAQADQNYKQVSRSLRGVNTSGGFESRAILGNSHVWTDDPDTLKKLKKALRWIAEVPTTNETGLLGGAWMVYPEGNNGRITTMLSQPHVWNQSMFYLAALRTYGTKPWTDR